MTARRKQRAPNTRTVVRLPEPQMSRAGAAKLGQRVSARSIKIGPPCSAIEAKTARPSKR